MESKILIEKLLVYAKENLRLNELDVDLKRAYLYWLFNNQSCEFDKLFAKVEYVPEKDEIVSLVTNFAKKTGLTETQANSFLDEVFAILTPPPSIIGREFKLLREQMDAEKATDYFYDLSIKNNFVSDANYVYLEPKSQRKTQIFSSKRKSFSEDNLQIDYFKKKNMRAVKFTFDGDDYLMRYLHHHDYIEQGELARENNEILPLSADTFDRIFDFLDFIPNYFSTAVLVFDNENNASVQRFFVGKDNFPLFDAKTVSQMKSSSYQDVEISLTDYVLPNLRLSSYNKNTIISLTLDIIEGFKKTEFKSGFFPNFSFRFLADGRYCLDIVIAKISQSTNISTFNDDYFRVFSNCYYSTLLMGRFVLDETAISCLEEAKEFLTKKGEVSEDMLTLEISPLFKVGAILKEIIENNGYFRDVNKAETYLLEKLYDVSEIVLKNLSPYSSNAEGRLKFKEFLLTVGVE